MFDFSAKRWNCMAKVMCGVCVLWMLLVAVFAVYRWNYLRRTIITKATITNLIAKKDENGHLSYSPVYVFTDRQGQSVKVTSSTASFPPPGEVGDKIEVLYDPQNPQHSIQNRFFSVWGIAAIAGGVGAFDFVFFAVVAIFTGRHLKEAENKSHFATAAGPSY